jgi:excisionase family DNA binding protein
MATRISEAMNTKQAMTTKEATDYLGVSPTTLAVWRSRDKGPRYYRMGGFIRYRKEDLDAFVEAVEPQGGK